MGRLCGHPYGQRAGPPLLYVCLATDRAQAAPAADTHPMSYKPAKFAMSPMSSRPTKHIRHNNHTVRTRHIRRSRRMGRATRTAICLAACSLSAAPGHLAAQTEGRWFKGNTHAHTTNSDGDSPPEYVAQWYREAGYDFLVLSDHYVFTDPATLSHLTDDGFILIPGEEVTSAFEASPIHVNALNIDETIDARTGRDVTSTLQANVDAIREAGGVPHINHPNFEWAFGAKELARVQRTKLLEIFNGHPTVHNEGGGGFPSLERIWDLLLTGGKEMYGIAVDDAHHFQGEFRAGRANPGRGWVKVWAERLDPLAIVESLEAGRFFASTGVDLRDVTVDDRGMRLDIVPQEGRFRYTTTFIGADGEVLGIDPTLTPTYRFKGTEMYVRALVERSDGARAWVQPHFLGRR